MYDEITIDKEKTYMGVKGKVIILILVILGFVSVIVYINIANLSESNQEQIKQATETNIKTEEEIATQKEKLELTQDKVELEVGAIFDFSQYIKIAEDKYGYNVKDKITTNGNISTETPGHYQVEYKLDLGDNKSISKILDVTVKEFKE